MFNMLVIAPWLLISPILAESNASICALDAKDHELIAREAPYTMNRIKSGDKLSTSDIKTMTQLGISDDKIIGTIRTSNSTYYLSSSDVEDLKDHGVSDRVIDAMRKTGSSKDTQKPETNIH